MESPADKDKSNEMKGRAVECFRSALALDAGNEQAREELAELTGESDDLCAEANLRFEVSEDERASNQLGYGTLERAKQIFNACGVVVLSKAFKTKFVKLLLKVRRLQT